MVRLGAIAAGAFMGLIAGCAGAAFYYYYGMTSAESTTIALAAFVVLAVFNSISTRLRDRSEMGGQIADLSRGTADLGRQVLELGRRVAALEVKADKAFAEAAEASRPLAAEVERLSAVVDRIAPSIAAVAAAATAPARADGRFEGEQPVTGSARAVTGGFEGMDRDAMIALAREAVEANRIELYLQPIVSLPQRKVKYYEALPGLRTRYGDPVPPAAVLPYVEAAGLTARIDNAMLFRSVQAARRLSIKNREVGLFCSVAAATLADPAVFPEFIEFADANRAIAPAFVFVFSHAAYRSMGSKESEGLGALAARGFRFMLDHVGDLRLEARDLAGRGFRFVRAPASLLLNRTAALAANIDPSELAAYLGGFGIDLIAEKIERESTVVDLLDYEVRLGQGALFSPPRPVRSEVLQGVEPRELGTAAASVAESVESPADISVATRADAGLEGPGPAPVQLAPGTIART